MEDWLSGELPGHTVRPSRRHRKGLDLPLKYVGPSKNAIIVGTETEKKDDRLDLISSAFNCSISSSKPRIKLEE